MQLAELNLGVLRYDWDDPRVQSFVDGVGIVNRVAERSEGFIWRVADDDMDAAQRDPNGPFGNPRTASTMSVWRDLPSLENFIWNTIHKRFYDRRAEWYDAVETIRFVLWQVPEGFRPSLAEGMKRFRHLDQSGDTDFAFGWAYAKEHLNASR